MLLPDTVCCVWALVCDELVSAEHLLRSTSQITGPGWTSRIDVVHIYYIGSGQVLGQGVSVIHLSWRRELPGCQDINSSCMIRLSKTPQKDNGNPLKSVQHRQGRCQRIGGTADGSSKRVAPSYFVWHSNVRSALCFHALALHKVCFVLIIHCSLAPYLLVYNGSFVYAASKTFIVFLSVLELYHVLYHFHYIV